MGKLKHIANFKPPLSFTTHIPRQENAIQYIIAVISKKCMDTYHLVPTNQKESPSIFYTPNVTGDTVLVCTSH